MTDFRIDYSPFQAKSSSASSDDTNENSTSSFRSAVAASLARSRTLKAKNFGVTASESVVMSRIVSGDKNITKYQFRDRSTGSKSGRFRLNGKNQVQDKLFTVKAADLQQLSYVASNDPGSEEIMVRSFDSTTRKWSAFQVITAKTRVNANEPHVAYNNFLVRANSSFAMQDALRIRDEDKNTIKKYRFEDLDDRINSGFLTRNGIPVGANKRFTVNAEDLATIGYTAKGKDAVNRVNVEVFDGLYWSSVQGVDVQTISTPILSGKTGPLLDEFELVNLTSYFDKVDVGPEAVAYEIIDTNAARNSGHIIINGTPINDRRKYSFTASELDSVNVMGGVQDQRWLDEVYVRASNGLFWGGWELLDIRTEPVGPKALAVADGWNDYISDNVITYSFTNDLPFYAVGGLNGGNYRRFTAEQRNDARDAFDILQSTVDIEFREVSDLEFDPINQAFGGMLRINGMFDLGANFSGFAFLPSAAEVGGDIVINFPGAGGDDLMEGTFARSTFIHEVGHAIGLKHPFQGLPQLPTATDFTNYTIMSYTEVDSFVQPHTHMLYDLLALQGLYGARTDVRDGSNIYSWDNRRFFSETIWDPSGHDVIDASNQSVAVKIDLREGGFSTIGEAPKRPLGIPIGTPGFGPVEDNVAIAFGTVIEDARGGKRDDTITGNQVDNSLYGNKGDDRLEGRQGNDMLFGGLGSDTYVYGLGGHDDTINEQKLGGVDSLEINVPWRQFSELGDLTFKRINKDLVINLSINKDPLNGSIRIKNQGVNKSRVEKLRLSGLDGEIAPVIDLNSIYRMTNGSEQRFQLTSRSSAHGIVAKPV